MKLDRALQRRILEQLATAYPSGICPIVTIFGEVEHDIVRANLYYLQEHGLVNLGIQRRTPIGEPERFIDSTATTITAKGMDFLEDDGGLSAILGVVTIKLHADTIKELLADKIDASDLPPADKSLMKKHLETLSAEAIKTVAKYLVQQGLDHLPDAARWLQTLLRL
jgi:hypothetical protein